MRFAVIGSNFVSDWFLEAGKLCDDFELTTIYSRSIERARAYAEIHGAPHTTDSLDDLANSPHVDAVYIASPNHLHHSHTIQMLEAGKHVLCEKPIASNLRELQEMLDTARRNNVVLMEAIRPSYVPAMAKVQELLSEIAPVRWATLSFCQYSSRYGRFLSGEPVSAFDLTASGGALMDVGIYCIHVMLRLFGVPQSTQSCCVKLDNGVDITGTILADYGDKIVDIKYSKVTDDGQSCEIQGERGNIYFKKPVTLDDLRMMRRGEPAPIPVQVATQEHDMIYELEAFIRLANDPAGMAEENRYSVEAMRILDETRKQCGIVFPADK